MQSLPYSQLTETQLAQVRYLFADPIFGTDASAYLYEVDKTGEVKGRSSTSASAISARAKHAAPVQVTVTAEVNITERMIAKAKAHMDALAASIAVKIYQPQPIKEEVSNV